MGIIAFLLLFQLSLFALSTAHPLQAQSFSVIHPPETSPSRASDYTSNTESNIAMDKHEDAAGIQINTVLHNASSEPDRLEEKAMALHRANGSSSIRVNLTVLGVITLIGAVWGMI